MKLARLYPHDPKRGHVLQNYLATDIPHPSGKGTTNLKFVGKRGWYEVTDEQAAALAEAPQYHSGVHTGEGEAFMIADDAAEAKKMDAALEKSKGREEEKVGTADAPVQARPGTKTKAEGKPKTRRSTRAVRDKDD